MTKAQLQKINPLTAAVVKQIGGWDAFKRSARDIANYGITGGYSGFTYYNDTVRFGERHLHDILDHIDGQGFGSTAAEVISNFACVDLDAREVERALLSKKHSDRTEVMNALAWYAAESVAFDYVN